VVLVRRVGRDPVEGWGHQVDAPVAAQVDVTADVQGDVMPGPAAWPRLVGGAVGALRGAEAELGGDRVPDVPAGPTGPGPVVAQLGQLDRAAHRLDLGAALLAPGQVGVDDIVDRGVDRLAHGQQGQVIRVRMGHHPPPRTCANE
jgi:hypothetical protein